LLNERAVLVRQDKVADLKPTQWRTAIAPGGLYFQRMQRLYDEAHMVIQRYGQIETTCDCHSCVHKSILPNTHKTAAVTHMREHLSKAKETGTLTIAASKQSGKCMIHAAWGFANSHWQTFDGVRDGQTVTITAVSPLTFSKAAQLRREQTPKSSSVLPPDWY
jgi:hypothetical protein